MILATASVVYIGALTAIAHKEVRFIYPLLPALIALAARPLLDFMQPIIDSVEQPPKPDSPNENKKRFAEPTPLPPLRTVIIGIALTFNVVLALYASNFHNSGIYDIPGYFRTQFEAANPPYTRGELSIHDTTNITPLTVGIFMPCHSTPWRANFVYGPGQIKAWALTCEPPLDIPPRTPQRKAYMDEADVFYADPPAWLSKNMAPIPKPASSEGRKSATPDLMSITPDRKGIRPWPRYLVFFAQLEGTMQSVLGPAAPVKDGSRARGTVGYEQCWRSFNSLVHEDWRRQGDVIVWCWGGPFEEEGSHGYWNERPDEQGAMAFVRRWVGDIIPLDNVNI